VARLTDTVYPGPAARRHTVSVARRETMTAVTETNDFVLSTVAGTKLRGVVDLPAAAGPRPTVVICHGFKGFFEWGFFPSLAHLLAERGFTVVRFNFSGTGMSPGDDLVTDLDAFRDATFSKDLEELRTILGALGTEIAPGRVDGERIGLLGHSRGGGTALLASADPAWQDRLGALVTWAAVGTFDRMGEEQKAAWRESGEVVIENARTGQALPMGVTVLEDLEAHRQQLDLAAAAGRRTVPWLIVHGSDDETVPVAEARDQASVAAPPCRLEVVGGGGHTFGAKHPWAGPTPHLTAALNATQDWFRRHLTPAGS